MGYVSDRNITLLSHNFHAHMGTQGNGGRGAITYNILYKNYHPVNGHTFDEIILSTRLMLYPSTNYNIYAVTVMTVCASVHVHAIASVIQPTT